MKAVVVDEIDKYGVTDVDLDPPKIGEVLIKMKATGVCHSDLSVANGTIPSPLPTVLGHEGAGVVEQVGEGGHQCSARRSCRNFFYSKLR